MLFVADTYYRSIVCLIFISCLFFIYLSQGTVLPPTLGLSASHMSQAGVYLVEDGECMMLWIGKAVDPTWLRSVFGVDNVDHVNPEHADSLIGKPIF